MSNTLGIDFAADAGEIAEDFPTVLTWSGQTITGYVSTLSVSDDVSADDELRESDLEWVGQVADFTSSILPAMRATVSIGSVKYYIVQRVVDEESAAVKLVLRRSTSVARRV